MRFAYVVSPRWGDEACLEIAEMCWMAGKTYERAMWVWLLRWAGAPA